MTGLTGANFGVNYCAGALNSTGAPAVLAGWGDVVASANDVRIEGRNLPANSACFVITGMFQGFAANPQGSFGNLCLQGPIGRYVGPGQIMNTGASGSFSLQIDLTVTPTPTALVAVQAGQTWNYQAWYRDTNGGAAISNFSTGLSVTYQ